MSKVKTQHEWYREHERMLDEVVGDVVVYNVSHLVTDLLNTDCYGDDEDLINVTYKIDNSLTYYDGDTVGEPQMVEALEHWVVVDWFGEELRKQGEMVQEFKGLVIWGRQTSGQSISMDYVVQDVLKDIVQRRDEYEL